MLRVKLYLLRIRLRGSRSGRELEQDRAEVSDREGLLDVALPELLTRRQDTSLGSLQLIQDYERTYALLSQSVEKSPLGLHADLPDSDVLIGQLLDLLDKLEGLATVWMETEAEGTKGKGQFLSEDVGRWGSCTKVGVTDGSGNWIADVGAFWEGPFGFSREEWLIQQLPVGVVVLVGDSFSVNYVNKAYQDFFGKSRAELLGDSFITSMPEHSGITGTVLEKVVRTGEVAYFYETEIAVAARGTVRERYFNFILQPIPVMPGEEDRILITVIDVTREVRSRKAVEKREFQYRSLFARSQFAKAIFSSEDMVIRVANESMLKDLWRRTLKEVEGKKLTEVFPELEGQPFQVLLRKVYQTGEVFRGNEVITYIDGYDGMKRFYLDFQYVPMFGEKGEVEGVMVSANNVTEKVEFRQRFEDAAERLSLATDGTQLATWDLNLQTNEIIYSQWMSKIFGVDEQKNFSHTLLREMLHPEDKSIVEAAFSAALQDGVYAYDARIIREDKSIRWIRTQGKVVFDANRVPQRMLGTLMDITDRKEAEFALQSSEEKFRLLSDSMPQLIWTTDTVGNLTYFNKAVYDYSGLTFDELQKNGWLQIVHPDDRAENVRVWKETLQLEKNFVVEHRFRRFDGEYRWQLSNATPQRDQDGSIQMWVGTTTDIHDRKLFIGELESQVRQRTRELTLMNNELAKMNLELGQFAYVASHDLQEPLRKIQALSTRVIELEQDNFSPKGRDYLERVIASSVRMQQLINDLLAFSRANAVERHFEQTDLNRVLENVREHLSESIQEKGAVLSWDGLPVLNVIVYQMEQLFTNLIANSLKFSKKDTRPVITVSCHWVQKGGILTLGLDLQQRYCHIVVQDNGIGFEPEYSDRIFQVFQRLHGKNSFEGTGIGLAICKKIVENHQGVIRATGMPGEGAVFSVYLPLGQSID